MSRHRKGKKKHRKSKRSKPKPDKANTEIDSEKTKPVRTTTFNARPIEGEITPDEYKRWAEAPADSIRATLIKWKQRRESLGKAYYTKINARKATFTEDKTSVIGTRKLLMIALNEFMRLYELHDFFEYNCSQPECYSEFYLLSSGLIDDLCQQYRVVQYSAVSARLAYENCLQPLVTAGASLNAQQQSCFLEAVEIQEALDVETERWAYLNHDVKQAFLRLHNTAKARARQEDREEEAEGEGEDENSGHGTAGRSPMDTDSNIEESSKDAERRSSSTLLSYSETVDDDEVIERDAGNDVIDRKLIVERDTEDIVDTQNVFVDVVSDETVDEDMYIGISELFELNRPTPARRLPATWIFKDAALYETWSQIFPPAGQKDKSSDMTWEDFVKVMTCEPLSFEIQKAPHAGVELRFVRPAMDSATQMSIVMHKPHGSGVLQRNFVWNVKTRFRRKFGWTAEDFALIEED